MKSKLHNLIVLPALLALCTLHTALSTASAQGTAFTYQGQLQNNGSPANGNYDFEFSLSNAPSGGSQVGSTITQTAIGVTNGQFTTTIDFGTGIFTGPSYWLSISVRSNGVPPYTTLTPPQELTPTPYAIFANTASNLSGKVQNTSLPTSPTFSGTVTATSFSGSGRGSTDIPAGPQGPTGPQG